MTDDFNKKKLENAKKIAEKFFGGISKNELPTADMLLRALAIAKGKQFSIKAVDLEALKKKPPVSADSCPVMPGDQCSVPRDFCIACDHPDDNCNLCDAADCLPVGPDPGPV